MLLLIPNITVCFQLPEQPQCNSPCGRQFIGPAFVFVHSGPFVRFTLSLCPPSLLLLLFSIYWFSLVHFVQQTLHFSLTDLTRLSISHFFPSACPSSIWRGADSSPGQVPGADGESESEESRLCLQTPLRGLPAEVISYLSVFSPRHSHMEALWQVYNQIYVCTISMPSQSVHMVQVIHTEPGT